MQFVIKNYYKRYRLQHLNTIELQKNNRNSYCQMVTRNGNDTLLYGGSTHRKESLNLTAKIRPKKVNFFL